MSTIPSVQPFDASQLLNNGNMAGQGGSNDDIISLNPDNITRFNEGAGGITRSAQNIHIVQGGPGDIVESSAAFVGSQQLTGATTGGAVEFGYTKWGTPEAKYNYVDSNGAPASVTYHPANGKTWTMADMQNIQNGINNIWGGNNTHILGTGTLAMGAAVAEKRNGMNNDEINNNLGGAIDTSSMESLNDIHPTTQLALKLLGDLAES